MVVSSHDPPPLKESPLIDLMRRQNNILEHIAYNLSQSSDMDRSLVDLGHGFTCNLCRLHQK